MHRAVLVVNFSCLMQFILFNKQKNVQDKYILMQRYKYNIYSTLKSKILLNLQLISCSYLLGLKILWLVNSSEVISKNDKVKRSSCIFAYIYCMYYTEIELYFLQNVNKLQAKTIYIGTLHLCNLLADKSRDLSQTEKTITWTNLQNIILPIYDT